MGPWLRCSVLRRSRHIRPHWGGGPAIVLDWLIVYDRQLDHPSLIAGIAVLSTDHVGTR
jgi:hypothetical protein